jgi:hypothetical protein
MLLFARIRDELRQWEAHADRKAKRRAIKLMFIAINRTMALTTQVDP